ncbi:MAG: hypothetical protein WC044_08150 [Crocinitomicaceae bacterium]
MAAFQCTHESVWYKLEDKEHGAANQLFFGKIEIGISWKHSYKENNTYECQNENPIIIAHFFVHMTRHVN